MYESEEPIFIFLPHSPSVDPCPIASPKSLGPHREFCNWFEPSWPDWRATAIEGQPPEARSSHLGSCADVGWYKRLQGVLHPIPRGTIRKKYVGLGKSSIRPWKRIFWNDMCTLYFWNTLLTKIYETNGSESNLLILKDLKEMVDTWI